MRHLDEKKMIAYLGRKREFSDPALHREATLHIVKCAKCTKRIEAVRQKRRVTLSRKRQEQPVEPEPLPDESSAPESVHLSDRQLEPYLNSRDEFADPAIRGAYGDHVSRCNRCSERLVATRKKLRETGSLRVYEPELLTPAGLKPAGRLSPAPIRPVEPPTVETPPVSAPSGQDVSGNGDGEADTEVRRAAVTAAAQEVEAAREEARAAQAAAEAARREAETARREAEAAKAKEAKEAHAAAEAARREAARAREEAEAAKREAEEVRRKSAAVIAKYRAAASKSQRVEAALTEAEAARKEAEAARKSAEVAKRETAQVKAAAKRVARATKERREAEAARQAELEAARAEAEAARREAEEAREAARRASSAVTTGEIDAAEMRLAEAARKEAEAARREADAARREAEAAKEKTAKIKTAALRVAEASKRRREVESAHRAEAEAAKREAEEARREAERARLEAEAAKREAEALRQRAERNGTEVAEQEAAEAARLAAEAARTLAEAARREAEVARKEAEVARQEAELAKREAEAARQRETPGAAAPAAGPPTRRRWITLAAGLPLIAGALWAGFWLRGGAGDTEIPEAAAAGAMPVTEPPAGTADTGVVEAAAELATAEPAQSPESEDVPPEPEPAAAAPQPTPTRVRPEPVPTQTVPTPQPAREAAPQPERQQPPPPPPRVVSGVVRDGATDAPVAGARISIAGTGTATTSGPDGSFRLDGVPGGDIEVVAQADGYRDGRIRTAVAPGSEARLELVLTTSTPPAAPSSGPVTPPAQPAPTGPTVLPTREETDPELVSGVWVRIDRSEAEELLGRSIVGVPDLPVESMAKPGSPSRRGVRIAQTLPSGGRLEIVITRPPFLSRSRGGGGDARVSAVRVAEAAPGSSTVTGTARVGGYLITAKADVTADAMRALLNRIGALP